MSSASGFRAYQRVHVDRNMPDVTIMPSEDGPYIVTGLVTLVAPDGHEIEHPDPMSDLSLRGIVEQAVLRRDPRRDRLRRHARQLKKRRLSVVGAIGPAATP